MKKLSPPNMRSRDVLTTCSSKISDTNYKHKLDTSRDKINKKTEEYNTLADVEGLHTINGVFPQRGEDPIIINELKRSELTKLYTQQMVPRNSPGRSTYDEIFVIANDQCPFCGGIGQVYTLDHYLPKANFPIYSVHPGNLVPCCRDCNTGKFSALLP